MAPETNHAQREAAVAYWRRSLEIGSNQTEIEALLEAALGRAGNP